MPFADHAAEAFVQGDGVEFFGGEPAEVAALFTDNGRGGLGCDEHETDIVMEVGRVGAVGGDLVDVEIEGALGGYDKALDAGLLEGLAAGDTENVFIAIAVAAELEPAVEFAMVMKEDAGAVEVDN